MYKTHLRNKRETAKMAFLQDIEAGMVWGVSKQTSHTEVTT